MFGGTIYTDTLADIASAAAGRNVDVRFCDGQGDDGEEINGDATDHQIRLSRKMWLHRRDACYVFLHELGHTLLRHAGRVMPAQAEPEADQFADAVRQRIGSVWFDHALKGSMLKYERDRVTAAIQEVYNEMAPTADRSELRSRLPHTELRERVTQTQGLMESLRAQGRLTTKLEEAMGRTIHRIEDALAGRERRDDVVMEYAAFPAEVEVV